MIKEAGIVLVFGALWSSTALGAGFVSLSQDAPAATGEEVAAAGGLTAVIMEVRGRGLAKWRQGEDGEWKQAEPMDVLGPGVEIRTGLGTEVALRVGKNATVIVQEAARVAIPVIEEDPDENVLRTRFAMARGKVDFKVDKVGATNDFEVATPTSTLAVKGTEGAVSYGGLEGTRVAGVQRNEFRAIELRFVNNATQHLSGQGAASDTRPNPVNQALFQTVDTLIQNGTSSSEQGAIENSGVSGANFAAQGIQSVSNSMAALDMIIGRPNDVPSPAPIPPDNGGGTSPLPNSGGGGGGGGSDT